MHFLFWSPACCDKLAGQSFVVVHRQPTETRNTDTQFISLACFIIVFGAILYCQTTNCSINLTDQFVTVDQYLFITHTRNMTSHPFLGLRGLLSSRLM